MLSVKRPYVDEARLQYALRKSNINNTYFDFKLDEDIARHSLSCKYSRRFVYRFDLETTLWSRSQTNTSKTPPDTLGASRFGQE
jgi:hypothetical protein